MNCPKCGLQNPEGARYCMRCGKELLSEAESQAAGELFCYKHPKTATQLSCGRCGRPVCTKCVVLGPAGPRCRECARQNVSVRPGAVFYGVKRSVLSLFRSGPWTIYIWILLASMVFGAIRGCSAMQHRPTQDVRPDVERRDQRSSDN